MKITQIKHINKNMILTAYGTTKQIRHLISKNGEDFYLYNLKDRSGMIEVMFQPDAPMSKLDFSKKVSRLKINIRKRFRDAKVYTLVDYKSYQTRKLKFILTTDYQARDNVLFTKEELEKNACGHISIHWQLALENITYFEKLVNENREMTVAIYGLGEDQVERYRKIFQFISEWGHLIYHNHIGLVKKHKSLEKTKRLKLKAELLKDLDYKGYGCFGPKRSKKLEKEQEICNLIYEERKALLTGD